MAIFKVAKRSVNSFNCESWNGEDGSYEEEIVCKYPDPRDLDNLMKYCFNGARYVLPVNIQLYGPESVASQFLYVQKCSGKNLTTRAHHFILSFNTGQYEKFVDESTIDIIMYFFALRYLKGHQAVLFLHTNKKSHYHVHIVIDPVNFRTYKTFRYNIKELKLDFASTILKDFGIALQGVTYLNENHKVRIGNESDIYQYQYLLGKVYYI